MRPGLLRLPARHRPLSSRTPHIAIAGAGIGGLTAALALARAGADVTLLERRREAAEFGAGLQLSPPATRVLDMLGLGDALRSLALEPRSVRVRRGRDAAEIVRFPLGAHAVARYGSPFLLVLRPALQRLLIEAAAASPSIRLRYAAEVGAVEADADGRAAVDSGAGRLIVDGFVDARGLGAARARPSGRMAWRALVPAATLDAAHLRPDTNLWLGHRTHLVHYPVPGGLQVNVVAVTEADSRDAFAGAADPWSRPGDPAVLRRAFGGWHRDALSLFEASVDWRTWPLFDAAPLPRWSHGPLTVLGDAAHPMLPFLAQGASQAIEDAGTLAECLAAVPDVPSGFAAYADRRRPRATRVQAASRRQADIYHLGRPAADGRDLALRLLGGARALARMDWLYGPA